MTKQNTPAPSVPIMLTGEQIGFLLGALIAATPLAASHTVQNQVESLKVKLRAAAATLRNSATLKRIREDESL